MNSSDVIDYAQALLKVNGVSVLTVQDGWVFTFSKEKLLGFLSDNGEAENIVIFVKNSES